MSIGAARSLKAYRSRIDQNLADTTLAHLIERFDSTGHPIRVSFRDMLPTGCTKDRASHDLHPYPARLLLNIPAFFLSTSLTQPGELVVDPFCGSGTVLLEAILAGRNASGADANPLAQLITRAKLTPISCKALRSVERSFLRQLPNHPVGNLPSVGNLEYWFYPHIRRDLLILRERISRFRNPQIQDFLCVVFSACLKDVSLADPRLSVPVRLRQDKYPAKHWLRERMNKRLAGLRTISVGRVFSERLHQNIARIDRLSRWPGLGNCKYIADDARSLGSIKDSSVDLIITSPPYLGAQKYIRASSLSLAWLGLAEDISLRKLEDCNIGREHYLKCAYKRSTKVGIPEADILINRARIDDPLRAHIAASYMLEMHEAIREMARVLKPKRHAVIVAGVSCVRGISFPTPKYISMMAQSEGLSLRLHLIDGIRSRALMTKRHHSAGIIDSESILLFQKGA